MSSRDEILDALRNAAAQATVHAQYIPAPLPAGASPAVDGSDVEGLISRFLERVKDVRGEALRAPNTEAALVRVREVLERWGVQGVTLSPDPLVLELGINALVEERKLPFQWLDGGEDEERWRGEVAAASAERRAPRVPWDLAITGCEGAIAETGSVIHRTGPTRGRAGWLLCRAHLVLLDAEQIVPDLENLFVPGGALENDGLPRAVTVITGPSRTADIEQTLTVGVHGPGRFCAIVIG